MLWRKREQLRGLGKVMLGCFNVLKKEHLQNSDFNKCLKIWEEEIAGGKNS